MLLVAPAAATDLVPDRAVIFVSAESTINAGRAESVQVQNLGGRPATLRVDRGVGLGSGASSVQIPAGGAAKIAVRYDAACPPSSWGACATGSVWLVGTGGTLQPRVQILPSGVGVLSMRPPRLYWDPSGPVPPTTAFGGVDGALGALGGLAGGEGPTLPNLPVGAPRAVTAPKGKLTAGLSYARGVASQLEGLETAVANAAAACDVRTDGAFSLSGELSWGADGRVSGVRVDDAVGADERCLVLRLFAGSAGAGPGEGGFRVSGGP